MYNEEIQSKVLKDVKEISLPKSTDKQLVFNFAKEENEDEVIVHDQKR